MKLRYLIKVIPAWALLTMLSVSFLLLTVIPRFFTSYIIPDNQLAYLTISNGEVNVSDGISDVTVRDGALISRTERTILKTGHGNANLKMRDGSFVILDSKTTIEFNRKYKQNSKDSFAFNLIGGRVLVINGQDSNIPTLMIVGGNFTAEVFQAMIGLEVKADEKIQERVDCLVGPCLVNGVFLLVSGQRALIGSDGIVQVTRGIPYDAWISLGKAGVFNTGLSDLFARIVPTPMPGLTPTPSPTETVKVSPKPPGVTTSPASSTIRVTISPTATLTPSPSITYTREPKHWPTLTPLPTKTQPKNPTPVRSRTPTPTRTLLPTSTRTSLATSTQIASPTPTRYLSPTSTWTSSPVPTQTPAISPTFSPTETATPTNDPTPTPTPTNDPTPTRKATRTPTYTPLPTDTPVPTPTSTSEPPTDTPVPTPTSEPPTDTPVPTPTSEPPTDTPVPTPTSEPPTDVPVPTSTPQPPTDTPVPPTPQSPTETPVPTPVPPEIEGSISVLWHLAWKSYYGV